MVKTIKFNPKEKAVLDLLYKKTIPLSPYAIHKEIGLSYITVKKYVAKLLKDELLVEASVKNGKVVFKSSKPKKKTNSKRSETKRYTLNPKVFC